MKTYEYRHLRRGYRSRTPSTHKGANTQPKPKKLPSHQGFKWNRYLIVDVARSRGRTRRFSGAGAGQAAPAHLSSSSHASNPPHPLPHEIVDGTDDATFSVAGSDQILPENQNPLLCSAISACRAFGMTQRKEHQPQKKENHPCV